jgi:DNA repair exonuclease SbcCD ATPase subunit
MENYREFAHSNKPPEVPEWLQGKQTNPKRMQEDQMKKTPLEQFKGTATRAPPKQYSSNGLSGENEPKNDIQDYGGSTNFSFFNEETEIKSAFDDAFYTTGIDPDKISEDTESLETKLKKMESMRGSIAAPEKKVENIHELFNQEESEVNQNVYTNDKDLPKVHQQYKQQYQQQQQQNQQYRNQTPQLPQPPQQQYQQNNQQQQLVTQLQLMHGKVAKYEDYLKTLMEKYNELKAERDNLKHKLLNMNETNTNKYSSDAMEEKKKELIQLSTKVQNEIKKLEELQQKQESNQEEE